MAEAKKAAKKRTEADPSKVRYLVKDTNGEFVIELPTSWKITFANVNPAANSSYDRGLHCLRVYDGTKLRAVYSSVSGVRDLSIPMARKVARETGSAEWTKDSEGSFERTEKVDRNEAFVLDAGDDPFGG